jgi:hypothetical protein
MLFLIISATCIVAVDAFPKGVARCLRPSLIDSHIYVGGSGGNIAVLSVQNWKVLHTYNCLPPSKKTHTSNGGKTDVLGNPVPSSRAASAGRIRYNLALA